MFGRIGKLPHERVTLAWNLECARRVPTCREGDGAFAVALQFGPYVLVVSNDLFTESIQSAVRPDKWELCGRTPNVIVIN